MACFCFGADAPKPGLGCASARRVCLCALGEILHAPHGNHCACGYAPGGVVPAS